jgi:hypothetical protein
MPLEFPMEALKLLLARDVGLMSLGVILFVIMRPARSFR